MTRTAPPPAVTRAINRAARREIAARFALDWRAPFVAVYRLTRLGWLLTRGTARVASATVRLATGRRRRGARGA